MTFNESIGCCVIKVLAVALRMTLMKVLLLRYESIVSCKTLLDINVLLCSALLVGLKFSPAYCNARVFCF